MNGHQSPALAEELVGGLLEPHEFRLRRSVGRHIGKEVDDHDVELFQIFQRLDIGQALVA